MRILGIDMASQPARTATAELVVSGDGSVRCDRSPSLGWSDDDLLERIAGCEVVGIDAPFGWPTAFAEALASWRSASVWESEGDPVLRRTDHEVWRRVRKRPLSVSTDRIAYAAIRTVHLLTRLGATPGPDGTWRAGRTTFVEVYPAGTLAALGIDARGARTPTGSDVRERVLAQVHARWSLDAPTPELVEAARRTDDELDAWLAALTAWRSAIGATHRPDPPLEDPSEGWIHLPSTD